MYLTSANRFFPHCFYLILGFLHACARDKVIGCVVVVVIVVDTNAVIYMHLGKLCDKSVEFGKKAGFSMLRVEWHGLLSMHRK